MIRTTGLAEIVLLVGNIEQSRRFYEGILGLKVISPDFGGPVFLQVGEDRPDVPHQIVLIPRPPDALAPASGSVCSLHHIGIVIPQGSVDDTRHALEAQGLTVRTGEHPFLNVEAIYVDDPDGNEVELVARR
jgi:catechol 2,3-dioxygenase-like lactoylglutathione lyase family enzyme